MHVHFGFLFDLPDQLYNLLGDGIGSWYDPILPLAEEDYITSILRQLRYCGQWAAHFAHLGQALV